MAEPEYLTRALQARRRTPDDRAALVDRLRQQQGRGAVLRALTRGQGGGQLLRGPTPEEMEARLDREAREDAYTDFQMERTVARDAAEDEYRRLQRLRASFEAERDDLDKEVAALSKGMEDLAPLEQAWAGVNQMLSRYGQENIPGVGRFEGAPGFIGKTLRLAQGDEAQLNFAEVERLMASIRRNQIGSQQTQRELANILQQVGQSGWESEAVFRDAVSKIGDAIDYERRSIYSRASPEAVDVFEARRGLPAAARPPLEQPGGGTRIGRFTIEIEQ